MQSYTFISSLEITLTTLFPSAEISFDGHNLSIHHKRSSRDFVLLLVDLTCMEENDHGRVAVHARPDHLFEKHWVVENGSRTLVLGDGQRFEGGDWVDGVEFADGHGNSMWMFDFPEDEGKISSLITGLVGISVGYFEHRE